MKRLSSVTECIAIRIAKITAAIALVWFVNGGMLASAEENAPIRRVVQKRIIGPTAIVAEAQSEISFKARVDTGARTSSVHVEEWAIENESPTMEENVGKRIRFCIKNHEGESQWLESRVEEISLVKTSEQEEQRYKVEMTICLNDVKKRIMVTLNDRSHMKYPMLLGRNFLRGDFVVDVELKKSHEAEPSTESAEEPAHEKPELAQVSRENSLENGAQKLEEF